MAKSAPKQYELIIIGAGPAGLGAALYAAREGMSVLVLERAAIGGMAAITDRIDNYPGFDQGVAGLELAEHLYEHAKRFGAEFLSAAVVSLEPAGSDLIVHSEDGQELHGETVLIATGSTYKHLGLKGEAALVGRGVHFCATCDAPLYRGRDVLVVGGGNSAVQESLFIAKFAKHVTLMVRGPELTATEVLREQLKAMRNVSYRFNTQVRELRSRDGKLTGVTTVGGAGTETHLRTDALFVFIGLKANTTAFKGVVDLDEKGFVLTRDDYCTNVPGVYAAGDVRSCSTWQIATATGEGVGAALEIRKYLDTKHHAQKKTAPVTRARAKNVKVSVKKT